MMRSVTALLFTGGLCFLLVVIASQLDFGQAPMRVGQQILDVAGAEVGAANIVTSVLLAYRGFDTLGEVVVVYTAGVAVLLLIGGRRAKTAAGRRDEEGPDET